jgi:REP-associated tyrosine transposase
MSQTTWTCLPLKPSLSCVSYQSYTGQSKSPEWLQTRFILGCFAKKEAYARKKYRSFVEDKIGKQYESPLMETFGSSILGSPDFVDEISSTHVRGKEDVNIPTLRQFISRPTPEEIRNEAEAVFGDDKTLVRQVSIYLCHKNTAE